MRVNVNLVEFNNKSLIIRGYLDSENTDIKVLIIQRITTLDLVLPITIEVLPEVIKNDFIFRINMETYSNLLYKANIWDLFIEVNGERIAISMEKFKGMNATYIKLCNSIHEAKPYITAKKTLAIWIKQQQSFIIEDLNIEDQNEVIKLLFKCEDNYLNDNILNLKVSFRKKEIKDIDFYSNEILFNINKNKEHRYEAYINKSDFIKFNTINGVQRWDSYLRVELDKDHIVYEPLSFKSDNLNKDKKIEVLNSSLYYGILMGKENKLCIDIMKKNIKAELFSINFTDNSNIVLKGILSNRCDEITVSKLIIVERSVENSLSKEYEKYIPIELNEEVFYCEFSLSNIVREIYKEDNLVIDVYLQLVDIKTGFTSKVALNIKETEKINFEYFNIKDTNFSIKPYKTKINTLALYIKKFIEQCATNPIKIAVLGSCYSRSAFVSLQYFNPHYKEKYKIVYTQFHSSIPSIMSNPIKYEEAYFSNCVDAHKEFVKCDFEKTLFENLRISNPDYLIIDLYADAVRDLIAFDDNHIITGSFILKDSNYLPSIVNKARIISHESKEEFLRYWIPAVDKFISKILKYIPENRIILQKARMIDKYYSKNKEVKIFENDLYLVKRSNYYFEIMEKYILSKMPNMKVIDLSKFNYIGDEKFPYGYSTNHYESKYYKELIKQLDNIVICDMCNYK